MNDEAKNENDDKKIKEDFCPACIAIPIAMASGGVGTQFTHNKYIIWGSILVTVLMIFIYIYYKYIKKCSSCSFSSYKNKIKK